MPPKDAPNTNVADAKAADDAKQKAADDAELARMQREEDAQKGADARKGDEAKRAEARKEADDGKHPEHDDLVDMMVNNTGCSKEWAEESVAKALASRNEKSDAALDGIRHAQGGLPPAVDPGSNIPPYSPQRSGPDGRPSVLKGAPDVEGPGVPTLAGYERTLESLRQGDEELVAFKVPRAFRLNLQDYSFVTVPAGFQKIPKHLADHAWIRQNGAVPE